MLLESSWALNIQQGYEASCILCGTEAGAELFDGVRLNGEKYGRLYTENDNPQGCGLHPWKGYRK